MSVRYKDITVTKVVYRTYEFSVGVLRIETNFLQKKVDINDTF